MYWCTRAFNELVAKGIADFGRLLETQMSKQSDENNLTPPSRAASRQGSIASISSFMTSEKNLSYEDPNEEIEAGSVGTVGGWVYKRYFKAGRNCCAIFTVVLLCVLSQLSASGGDYFISEWVRWEENSIVSIFSENPACKTQVVYYKKQSFFRSMKDC